MKRLLLLLTFILSQGLIAAPIHDAAISGDMAEIVRLLDLGIDVNIQDRFNNAQLYYSTKSDYIEIIRLLLDRGADINARDRFNRIPLNEAVSALMLLDTDEDINAVGSTLNWIPLYYAVRRGHIDTVRLLLDKGADINARDRLFRTSLYYAFSSGRVDIVILLLDRGADINVRDGLSRILLHEAVSSGHIGIVRLLLGRGADINGQDGLNNTPLHYAVGSDHIDISDRIEIIELLINHPLCDHTIADSNGDTPEDIARDGGHQEIAAILHNADPVEQKIIRTDENYHGLQLLAAKVANKEGVYEEDYDELGTSVRHWITNIRKTRS